MEIENNMEIDNENNLDILQRRRLYWYRRFCRR